MFKINQIAAKIFLLPLMFVSVVSCAVQQSDKYCNVLVPPLDSGVNGIHGVYVFVFPKDIAEHYTGCQTVWDEDSHKWLVIYFHDGAPTKLDVKPSRLTKKSFSCGYKYNKLIEGNSELCFKFDEIKDGFPSIKKKSQMSVPKERDPRR